MAKKITLALVGTGRWGKNYIETIQNLPGIELPKQFIKTRNYKDLFGVKGIDGVIIASPTSTHYQIAKAFIEKGFNVLIEKPLTATFGEAKKLQKICQKHPNTIVMVGHIQIYDPGYQKLKRSLKLIGKIKTISFTGLQSTPREDASVLEDWGPHPIYMFMDILRQEPKNIRLNKTSNDNLRLTFTFSHGVKGVADIGSVSPERKRGLEAVGLKGKLTLDWSDSPKTLTYQPNSQQVKRIPFPDNISPLSSEISEFSACISKGRAPKTPMVQGLTVMKIIAAAKSNP